MRLHALKPAADGNGYVLRFSEMAGRRGKFHMPLPEGYSGRANALETDGHDIPTTVTLFHFVSIRI